MMWYTEVSAVLKGGDHLMPATSAARIAAHVVSVPNDAKFQSWGERIDGGVLSGGRRLASQCGTKGTRLVRYTAVKKAHLVAESVPCAIAAYVVLGDEGRIVNGQPHSPGFDDLPDCEVALPECPPIHSMPASS